MSTAAWVGAAAAFTALCAVTVSVAPASIQDDIAQRAAPLLVDASWAHISVDGRELVVEGRPPGPGSGPRLRRALEDLDGVRSVRLRLDEAPPPTSASRPSLSARERAALALALPTAVCQQVVDGLLARWGVAFHGEGAVIHRSSVGLLTHLSTVISHCPQARVHISGHTDDSGTRSQNRRLGEDRAAAVAEILVMHGVSRHRLRIIGAGASEPVADNVTRRGRALNQRIEITLLTPAS